MTMGMFLLLNSLFPTTLRESCAGPLLWGR